MLESLHSPLADIEAPWEEEIEQRVFANDFPFAIVYRPTKRASSSSPSHTIRVDQITGGLAYKTANRLFEPTCEAHAAQQWRYVSSGYC